MATQKQQKSQAQLLVELAEKNGAFLNLDAVGGEADIDTLLEEEIKRNKVGRWFRLEDGQEATLRFYAWNQGSMVKVHYKFNVIPRSVCPRLFDHDCEYCSRPDADSITRNEWIFQVYWYEVGKSLFFNYPENKNSPISDLLTYNKSFKKRKFTMADVDITLTQNGKDTSRSFTIIPGTPEPFDFNLLKGIPPMSRKELTLMFVSIVSPHLLGLEKEKNGDSDEAVAGLGDLEELNVFGESSKK